MMTYLLMKQQPGKIRALKYPENPSHDRKLNKAFIVGLSKRKGTVLRPNCIDLELSGDYSGKMPVG